jgi:hypothetical protein
MVNISVHEAVNRLGPELFPEAWTGKEHEARRELISEDEWLKIKDLAPARGGGAPGSAPVRTTIAASAATAPHRTGDPSSSSYQEEYRARKRYENACDRVRAGKFKAAILDPFTGKLHRASTALWRRFDADRMIEKGRAPIPQSLNFGLLVVKKFSVPSRPRTPLPASRIGDVIDALREELATENLTRPKQKDFVARGSRSTG